MSYQNIQPYSGGNIYYKGCLPALGAGLGLLVGWGIGGTLAWALVGGFGGYILGSECSKNYIITNIESRNNQEESGINTDTITHLILLNYLGLLKNNKLQDNTNIKENQNKLECIISVEESFDSEENPNEDGSAYQTNQYGDYTNIKNSDSGKDNIDTNPNSDDGE